MDLANQYNSKSPAVKRLMREACEMKEPTEDYSAAPVNDNLFEWHFTIRGGADSDFEGGVYHGRIIFPSEYPMKPPNIVLLTPNGRFETNKKICLTISGHHPETWQPSWCVRTALLALIAFMPTPGNGTVGSLDYTKEERQTLARKSKTWECRDCGKISNLLLPRDKSRKSSCDQTTLLDKETVPVTKEKTTEQNVESIEISNGYNQELIDKLLSETNKLLSRTDDSISAKSSDIENEELFENVELPDIQLTRLDRFNLISNILSNFSKSSITIAVIVALIALLLYRRIFLLN